MYWFPSSSHTSHHPSQTPCLPWIFLVDCLSSGNPVHVDHASAVKKRDHQRLWVDLLCLAFLGLGEPGCFHWKLTLSLGLWVIALDPAFITWHFSKFKTECCCLSLFWSPDCIFKINQLWQSGFSRVYSNSCCSSSFEPEIIEISQSSHKMSSNKILNYQESVTILNACTKKVT